MLTIAIVEGVRIVVDLNDHLPPHLHAFFSGKETLVSIATGEVLHGTLPRSKMGAAQGWLEIDREQVVYIWTEIRAGRYDGGVIG